MLYCNAVAWPSKLQRQEVSVCSMIVLQTSPDAKTIPRQPVVEDVTMAAHSAEDRVQGGSANVQSPQHVHAGVPSSPNPGSTTGP